MAENRQISLDYLKSILDYDPLSGTFKWKIRKGNKIPVLTMLAGTTDRWGHRVIRINQKNYMAHHVAWFYVNGVWPPYEIDHVNCERADNRIVNLRLVSSRWQQRANQKKRADSRSPFKGIRRHGRHWIARCTKNGIVQRRYGFTSPEKAHAAYCDMAHNSFGSFARES